VDDAPGMKIGETGGDLEGDPHFTLNAEGLDAGPVAIENDGVHASVLTELKDDSKVWLSIGGIRNFQGDAPVCDNERMPDLDQVPQLKENFSHVRGECTSPFLCHFLNSNRRPIIITTEYFAERSPIDFNWRIKFLPRNRIFECQVQKVVEFLDKWSCKSFLYCPRFSPVSVSNM
jgi:hypothetical protein